MSHCKILSQLNREYITASRKIIWTVWEHHIMGKAKWAVWEDILWEKADGTIWECTPWKKMNCLGTYHGKCKMDCLGTHTLIKTRLNFLGMHAMQRLDELSGNISWKKSGGLSGNAYHGKRWIVWEYHGKKKSGGLSGNTYHGKN